MAVNPCFLVDKLRVLTCFAWLSLHFADLIGQVTPNDAAQDFFDNFTNNDTTNMIGMAPVVSEMISQSNCPKMSRS